MAVKIKYSISFSLSFIVVIILTLLSPDSTSAYEFRGDGTNYKVYNLPETLVIDTIKINGSSKNYVILAIRNDYKVNSTMGDIEVTLPSIFDFGSSSLRPSDRRGNNIVLEYRGISPTTIVVNGNITLNAATTNSEPNYNPPLNVRDLKATDVTGTGFKVSWTLPNDIDYSSANIYLNGVYKANVKKNSLQNYQFSNLTSESSYTVKVTSVGTTGRESTGSNLVIKTNDITAPSNVTNLIALPTFNTVLLSWTNPPETDFIKVNIYENGVYQKSVTADTGSTSFFDNLDPETTYEFKVTSVDKSGNESKGSSITVNTLSLPEVREIINLKAVTKYNRVNLSWDNPRSDFFNHVKIYRKIDDKETTYIQKSFAFFQPLKVEAAENDDFHPLFETNGTYWNDLTVEPATTYSYKLTTVNIAEAESEGTTIQVTTEGEPLPEMGGGSYEEQENGDYLFTWTSPTTGQVKVLIDGKEYRIVDAAAKKILIQKADMKYDIWNKPKVSLVAISESGKEGTPTKPGTGGTPLGEVEMPFGPSDLLKSSMGLLYIVGPFLLLALAIYLVPRLKNVIVLAVQKRNERRY